MANAREDILLYLKEHPKASNPELLEKFSHLYSQNTVKTYATQARRALGIKSRGVHRLQYAMYVRLKALLKKYEAGEVDITPQNVFILEHLIEDESPTDIAHQIGVSRQYVLQQKTILHALANAQVMKDE